MGNNCPLCNLELHKEEIFYEDAAFIILRTKDLKGHRERMMIVSKEHVHSVDYITYDVALGVVEEIGKKIFSYAPKFVIMDSTFATIKEHWHLVATDLDPKSKDFDQILLTKWVKVVDNVNGDTI